MTPFYAFCLASPKSGEGKTTLSIALMRALVRRGLCVQPFKCGPDFIDPGFHALATGRPSFNLDTWMMGRSGVRQIWDDHVCDADVAVCEGVMGLFDSHEKDLCGSTADLALTLDIPIVLVVNVRGMANSLAAVVSGFQHYAMKRGVRLAGVVANQAGSLRHVAILRDVLQKEALPPLIGALPRHDHFLPERHLGLVPASESNIDSVWLDNLAELAEKNVDLDLLLRLCQKQRPSEEKRNGENPAEKTEKFFLGSCNKKRLGIAKDQAFCFTYPVNEEILQSVGWEIVPFSPLKDKHLPQNLDALYLCGGYPEVFARELSENSSMRQDIHAFAESDKEIYAECGGFMYLCQRLEIPQDQSSWEMCGVLDAVASMGNRLHSLGYREGRFATTAPFGLKGKHFRGHEYHWSHITLLKEYPPLFFLQTQDKPCGVQSGAVRASYLHLYFGEADLEKEYLKNSDQEQKMSKNTESKRITPAIMIQGTSSNAGKSLLVSALCRIFKQDGYKVAPFKAQNMSLNAGVTAAGEEMSLAQIVQAQAAGIAPDVRMNPILLKPYSDTGSEVVVLGRSYGKMGVKEYFQKKQELLPIVAQAYASLAAEQDIMVLEGAGSPAEINLKDADLVNMRMALLAQSPVLLVGDIDRGGLYASFLGTWHIFNEAERQLLAGFVVNKFRGDPSLLQPAHDYLQAQTGVPVLGVIPFIADSGFPAEDSLSEEPFHNRAEKGAEKNSENLDKNLDRIAEIVRKNIEIEKIYTIMKVR